MNVNELFMHAYEKQEHQVKVKPNRQKRMVRMRVRKERLEKDRADTVENENENENVKGRIKKRSTKCVAVTQGVSALAHKGALRGSRSGREKGIDAFSHVIA